MWYLKGEDSAREWMKTQGCKNIHSTFFYLYKIIWNLIGYLGGI